MEYRELRDQSTGITPVINNRLKFRDCRWMVGSRENVRSKDKHHIGSSNLKSQDRCWMNRIQRNSLSRDWRRTDGRDLTSWKNGRSSNRSKSIIYNKATNILLQGMLVGDQRISIIPWLYQYNYFWWRKETKTLPLVTTRNTDGQYLTISLQITSLDRPSYYTMTVQQAVADKTPGQTWQITSSLSSVDMA